MTREEAQELLEKYVEGKCSATEKAIVENWYNHAINEQKHTQIKADYETAKKHIYEGLPLQKKSVTVKLWMQAAAALIVLFLAFGLYLYHNYDKETPQPNTVVSLTNKPTLTLDNGKMIDLSDSENGNLMDENGVKIFKKNNEQLVYTIDGKLVNNENSISYNTLSIPKGGKYHIQLADGTNVWLNAASSLRYPSKFNDKERVVELSGEAYFEVAKVTQGEKTGAKKNIPFFVITPTQKVQVLGTHFNTRSYPEDEKTSTTLLEGSVKVSTLKEDWSGLLSPGEQVEIQKSGKAQIRQVNAEKAIAWKNGYFIFENEDIHSIMDQLARWYDIDVVYSTDVTKQKFGGIFSQSTELSSLLKDLESYGNIHFLIQGRRITVMQ
ncbi:FecR family protein [Pseudopedobacter beijingensis]|uniref:FecR family protein n=1 Tax=Pseudopedobacter beijingensis TaxID=1207056 RepID=A0ABW4IC97_9SPHI